MTREELANLKITKDTGAIFNGEEYWVKLANPSEGVVALALYADWNWDELVLARCENVEIVKPK